MSKGFVKEGDQEDVPLVLPRAPLPGGVTNYVTPAGMAALLNERSQLLAGGPVPGTQTTHIRHHPRLLSSHPRLPDEPLR